MTAVFTTAVKRVSWFSAVLSMNKAVVYLSQKEGAVAFCAATLLATAATVRALNCMMAMVYRNEGGWLELGTKIQRRMEHLMKALGETDTL